MEFRDLMKQKSNDELIEIVFLKAFNFQENAVAEAEEELNRRNIPNFQDLKNEVISKNFKDLSSYDDGKILEYLNQQNINFKKSEKEVKHILKMGNLPNERYLNLLKQFDSLTSENKIKNSSWKKLLGFALFFGGIGFTVLSYHSVAQTGGTYYIATGAIVFGIIYFFELI
jgi:hypothetical protein